MGKVDTLLARAARHLRIELSPTEYEVLCDPFRDGRGDHSPPYRDNEQTRHFWKHIPEYVTGRCPLCGACDTEPLDTYGNLHSWGHSEESFYRNAQRHIGCEHFVGVQTFIHLNGIVLNKYSGSPEIPYVMPIFLAHDPESHAVIHCLPICRVEEERFVPRYLAFMLTYYSLEPQALFDENAKRWEPGMGMVRRMFPWESDNNLSHWVTRGRLWWLDLDQDQDDLPLRNEPVEEFPYANIEGIRTRFSYIKGKLRLTKQV